jgi:hypothetical protein
MLRDEISRIGLSIKQQSGVKNSQVKLQKDKDKAYRVSSLTSKKSKNNESYCRLKNSQTK